MIVTARAGGTSRFVAAVLGAMMAGGKILNYTRGIETALAPGARQPDLPLPSSSTDMIELYEPFTFINAPAQELFPPRGAGSGGRHSGL